MADAVLTRLQEERLNDVNESRAILKAAEDEDRELTQEETNRWDALMANVDKNDEAIARRMKQSEKEKALASSAGTKAARDGGEPDPEQRAIVENGRLRNLPSGKEARAAFKKFLGYGTQVLDHREARALQMDSDIAGGFLVAPQEFVANLIVFVNDMVWMRQFSTVMSVTNAESLGVPVLDADPADEDWTAEIATGGLDSTMIFGKRELRPHPLAKRVKISNKLLRASTLDVEAIVIERLGYKFGVTAEKAYLLGTGSEQPLGVFTASANGIDTSRDVSTGNTTTAIGADGLIEAKFKLKGNYWGRATWIFHRDALKQIRKLKDGNGQYLWSPYGQGLANAQNMVQPNRNQGTILESPYVLSEYAPNTFTTGLYVGVVGDFSRYWIADSLALQIQRLVELYAETNQTGLIGRLETDGMPVLAEAFARVALA